MVYDGADHFVLLMVPREYQMYVWRYDLWAFANGSWSHLNVNPKSGPRAAVGTSLTYDAHDGYVLLFGGNYGFSATYDLRQTWTYVRGSWTQLSITSGAHWPSARDSSAMAYDARMHSVILYGGELFNQTQLNDTWKFSNGSWSRLAHAAGPPPRVRYAVTYDTSDGAIVVFGGSIYGTSRLLNETWTFSVGRWMNLTLTAGTAPSARAWSLMTDMPRMRGAILFGGTDYQWPNPTRPTDTWLFSGGAWRNLSTLSRGPPNPTDAFAGFIAYDPALGGALLFEAGLSVGQDGGIWILR
jgi:hypothetical protein